MGFGYLFLGYLITFVLYMTLGAIQLGAVAHLVGYAVMFYALHELNRYQTAFVWAKWLQIPLLVTALYSLIASLSEQLAWGLPFVNTAVNTVYEWGSFLLIMLFHLALLYAIRMLAGEVGLAKIAKNAILNMILIFLYAMVWIVARFPIPWIQTNVKYFAFSLTLLSLVWIICNLLLILSCAKNICPAGDEDQPARPSRFAWINRLSEAYARTRQKSIDNTTEQAEAYLRRRKEKRERKQKKQKKH